MADRLRVEAPGGLLEVMQARLPGWSRGKLKDRLRLGCVQVNGRTTTAHDHPLSVGDEVLVRPKADGRPPAGRQRGLTTLYADDDLIAIDKPAGLLSVSTDKDTERTALAMVRGSLSGRGPRTTVRPVHRLDRETSGVLLLSTSRDVCKAMQRDWASAEKTYLAIVLGHPDPPAGVIDQPLWEDRSLQVHVGRRTGSKDARTRFRTLDTGRDRALLEVKLDTGRRHQIRAHLAWLGHPVVGDKRFGTAAAAPRMGLHALRLEVTDPRTGQRLTLDAPAPAELLALLHRGP